MIEKYANRLLKNAGRYLDALNPIDLFNSSQMRKLKSSTNGFQEFGLGMPDVFNKGLNRIKANIIKHGDDAQIGSISDYMSGAKAGESRLNLDASTASFRQKVRKRTAMAATAYLGSSLMFGSDSIPNKIMGGAASLGVHGTIAAGLSAYAHPLAGVAYAGLGISNMLRPGNNIGPF